MIDSQTKRPLTIHVDGDAGPYIMVPIDQVKAVEDLLNSKQVSFWVERNAISLDGKPAVAVVNLGVGVDIKQVRHILDESD